MSTEKEPLEVHAGSRRSRVAGASDPQPDAAAKEGWAGCNARPTPPNSAAPNKGNRMKKLLAFLAVAFISLAITPFAHAQEGDTAKVTVTWSDDDKSVNVTSTKDLSNVVVADCAGTRHKHDGLNDGMTGTFTHPSGGVILTVWVKSGNNKSDDGPGYGEKFTNPDTAVCATTDSSTTDSSTTDSSTADNSTTAGPAGSGRPAGTPTEVAGVQEERTEVSGASGAQGESAGAPKTLASTGAAMFPVFFSGLVVMASGLMMRRLSRGV